MKVKDDTIRQLQRVTDESFRVESSREKLEEMLKFRIEKKKKPLMTLKEAEYPDCSPLEQLAMKDISALSKILVYSTPKDIVQLAISSKKMRVFCGTRICTRALC